jgi:hypothetical protein
MIRLKVVSFFFQLSIASCLLRSDFFVDECLEKLYLPSVEAETPENALLLNLLITC